MNRYLSTLLKFTSKDAHYPHLCGVHFNISNGIACATDGRSALMLSATSDTIRSFCNELATEKGLKTSQDEVTIIKLKKTWSINNNPYPNLFQIIPIGRYEEWNGFAFYNNIEFAKRIKSIANLCGSYPDFSTSQKIPYKALQNYSTKKKEKETIHILTIIMPSNIEEHFWKEYFEIKYSKVLGSNKPNMEEVEYWKELQAKFK